MKYKSAIFLFFPIVCFASDYRVLITNNNSDYKIDEKINVPFLGTSCLDIINNNKDNGDGYYFVGKNELDKIEVYCDMTTNGGGWTLVTRLNTTDSNVRQWADPFWTSSNEVGNLRNNNDYMSSYGSTDNSFSDVLLEYNYNSGVLKSAYKNSRNTINYYDSLNQALSLNNLDYSRFYTNSSNADSFFGSILSFQVQDSFNPSHFYDRFRIFNNKTTKDFYNQTGNIGTLSDTGNLYGWFTEAGYPSFEIENSHRSYLGTNKGGSHSVITQPEFETLLQPSEYYSTDIINIYIR